MPNIPQYVSNERPLEASNMGVEAMQQLGYHAERNARSLGQEIQHVGGIAQGLVKQAEQQTADSETASIYKQMSDLTAQAHQSMTQTLNTADPNDQQTLQKWQESYLQPQLDKIGEGLLTRQAQKEFQRTSAGLTSSLLDRGEGEWNQLQKDHVANSTQQTTINLGNAGVSDPASLPAILAQSDSGIDAFGKASNGAVSSEDVSKMKLNARNHIADVSATSLVEGAIKNPNFTPQMGVQVATQLNTPLFTQNMSPEVRVKLLAQLASAHSTQLVAQSAIFESRLPALNEQAKLTGDTRHIEAGIANYQGKTAEETVVARQKMTDQVAEDRAYYHVSQDAGLVPQSEEQGYLAQREEELRYASPDQVRAANVAHTQAKQFFTDRDKAFKSGTQAQFMIDHNETIKAYAGTFAQNPTAQNFDRYASYSEAMQHQIAPNAPISLLTPDVNSDISQTMHNLTGAGVPAVEAAIKGYSQKYGTYWPQIATEAVEKGAMTPAQYVASQL